MPGAMRMYKNKLPRNREWRIGRSERVRSGLSFSLTVNRENVVNVRNTRGLSTTALTRDGEREARGCGAREAEGDRAPAGGRGAWGETESRGRARRAAPGSATADARRDADGAPSRSREQTASLACRARAPGSARATTYVVRGRQLGRAPHRTVQSRISAAPAHPRLRLSQSTARDLNRAPICDTTGYVSATTTHCTRARARHSGLYHNSAATTERVRVSGAHTSLTLSQSAQTRLPGDGRELDKDSPNSK